MTIEERADAYVGHPEEIDEFTSETIKRDAYIRGAKEQKAIDIEKACEWICECCPAQLGNDNGLVGCESKRDIDCPTIKSLIKVMEE